MNAPYVPPGVTAEQWAEMQAAARTTVTTWPRLTADQKDQLRAILDPAFGDDRKTA